MYLRRRERVSVKVRLKEWRRQGSQNKFSTIGFSLRNQHSPKESDVPMQVFIS
jgi:hypothetical protein